MRFSLTSLVVLGTVVAVPLAAQAPAPQSVVVNMTAFQFNPDRIHVSPGDTVVFVHAGAMPHNVEFTFVPAATRFADGAVTPFAQTGSRMVVWPATPRKGPTMSRAGQTYAIVITDDFAFGTHHFVCSSHESVGMKGTLVVQQRVR